MIKITFIQHSSFAVEFENVVLLFDYYDGRFPEFLNKKIYSFTSHKHGDHFSLKLFDLEEKYSDIVYIFSSDVKVNERYLERKGIDTSIKNKIITAKKDDEFKVDDLEIKTLKSTDEGVAYLINYKGKVIYHGGDLNWWHWEEESEEDKLQMKIDYTTEIDKLKNQKIDIAFVPVDGRLGKKYYYGIDYFMRNTKTKAVFPMHLWEDYDLIYRLKKLDQTKDYRDRIIEIYDKGQIFELE
ncbi:MBL fold metallo-hydrolase [Anaerosacchariphilus polymeriproducens]|uniref:MBL fold metallo-hydrolase n=1 Tax=Anaerosacchariphilus polymeriproducens TaxID=1812858 RepID=A0A371ATR4_9FIRM|nr:MBL fold metallo-hydrolase [Anaerosacchariphilus polymeriproducens]RDU22951.1 MBL fold metallo-hydrolase [Anaerosacchariphilus polymeriproducens]